ncbi:MAG: hypothetical protein ACTSSK_05210 [Candidatus Heimdallarchaeota archaeon]
MAKKGLNFPRKLKDALTIFSILALINYIIILVIFVQLPVARKIDIIEEEDSIYYWNGYTTITDLTNSSNVDEDQTTELSQGGAKLIVSSLAILILVNLVQIAVALFAKNMFLGNGLLLAGAIPFLWWSTQTTSEDITASVSSSIMYAFGIAIVVILAVIIVGTYASLNQKREKLESTN